MKKRSVLAIPDLLGELKRRRVYPVVAAYAVAAWVLLQIGEVTFEPLGLPGWAMTGLVIVVILGFPVTVTLAWIFDITRSGIQRDSSRRVGALHQDLSPSIAVLPFADMSPAQDQTYFCEGVAEEILNALTKVQQLRVAARSSSFRYADASSDVRQIGRELGVETVLEGSVRKSDNHLRITAELVNVSDGFHIWSRRFDKQLKDVFEIQDEIAKSIVQSLLETITPKQEVAIKTASSNDVLAYEYFLRGRHFINRFRKTDIEFARQMFRQAIEIDPDFALAWAGYSDCHSLLIMYADPKEDYAQEARDASKRALDLDEGLAAAHASRGLAHLVSENFESAEAQFKEALKLEPRLFEAHYYYARTKFHQGDMDAAADLFLRAAEVNPSDYQSRCLRVQILRGQGRITEAKEEAQQSVIVLEKHLEWNPDDARALHLGAGSLLVAGQVKRARRWLQRALEIDPDDSILLYNVACNFATLGDVEESMNYLERALDSGMVSLAWMRNDTDLANLRGHDRFERLLRRLENMTHAHIAAASDDDDSDDETEQVD